MSCVYLLTVVCYINCSILKSCFYFMKNENVGDGIWLKHWLDSTEGVFYCMHWCSSIMFVFIDFVLSVVFSVKFAVFLLAVVGIYAICWWLIDNLSSVVQVVRTLLQPYFQPQEDLSLIDRYGNWAGMFCLWNFNFKRFSISCLLYFHTHSMNLSNFNVQYKTLWTVTFFKLFSSQVWYCGFVNLNYMMGYYTNWKLSLGQWCVIDVIQLLTTSKFDSKISM